MLLGIKSRLNKIPLLFKMTIYSAIVFGILLTIIIFGLKLILDRKWYNINIAEVNKNYEFLKINYPDIDRLKELTNNSKNKLSIFIDRTLIYTNDKDHIFDIDTFDHFIFPNEGTHNNNDNDNDNDNEQNWAVINKRIMLSDETIILQYSINREDELFNEEIINFLLSILIPLTLIASFLSAYIALKGSLKQIHAITTAAENITTNQLDNYIPVIESNDELGSLTNQFNKMIKRLKIGIDEQKRFTADASHELRTPLSVINGYIGILDRWGINDKDIREESITAIKNECNYMTNLINNLLNMAQNDSVQQSVTNDEIDLKHILFGVKKRMEYAFPGRKVILDYISLNKFLSSTDVIQQVLQILIENSMKYDIEQQNVNVKCYTTDNFLFIEVKDFGPGISINDINLVFNRFYRVDKSRNRTTGGTGLGLSIAKDLVEKINGTISFIPQKNGALCQIILKNNNH